MMFQSASRRTDSSASTLQSPAPLMISAAGLELFPRPSGRNLKGGPKLSSLRAKIEFEEKQRTGLRNGINKVDVPVSYS